MQGGKEGGRKAVLALLQKRTDLLEHLADALYATADEIAASIPTAGHAPPASTFSLFSKG